MTPDSSGVVSEDCVSVSLTLTLECPRTCAPMYVHLYALAHTRTCVRPPGPPPTSRGFSSSRRSGAPRNRAPPRANAAKALPKWVPDRKAVKKNRNAAGDLGETLPPPPPQSLGVGVPGGVVEVLVWRSGYQRVRRPL